MANPLPPVPFKAPLTDENGLLTTSWSGFFREIFNQVGGNPAASNSTLSSQTTTLKATVVTLQALVDGLNQGPTL